MSFHEPSHAAAGIPLKAHVEELRSRCEAASRFQGGSTYFHEELGIFRAYLDEKGLYLKEPPTELSRPPDEEGNEHQVWYIPAGEAFLKATWPDFFGLLVIHRPNEEHKSSPIAYLERWQLHNELFGDKVTFLGALQTEFGLRLMIRQPAIAGTPATDEQIQQFNQSLKLLKTELEFVEQKLRMLTKSDGVFYEALFNQSETKNYKFDKCGEGKEVSKREM